MANFRAALKMGLFLAACGLLVPPQIIVLFFSRGRPAYVIPQIFHKLVCLIFGLRVETAGTPVKDRQTLFVGNHLSYLDICAIASVLPVSFVAKEDVAKWPLFGFLSTLQQTAFISRGRAMAHQGRDALQTKLADGNSLLIFPEGTSSDGQTVLPFKSSLFSIAQDPAKELAIQPFTIELVETDGRTPVMPQERDLYAWHGDMTLLPHLWAFAKLKGAKVKLHFHAPVQVKESTSRKELAGICRNIVAEPLAFKGEENEHHKRRSTKAAKVPAKEVRQYGAQHS